MDLFENPLRGVIWVLKVFSRNRSSKVIAIKGLHSLQFEPIVSDYTNDYTKRSAGEGLGTFWMICSGFEGLGKPGKAIASISSSAPLNFEDLNEGFFHAFTFL